MTGLRDGFQSYYTPDVDAVSSALRHGLVTLDTNVLLSLYRLQPEARDELFHVLEVIQDQLWVSHQAALEFHRNRLNVIAEQEQFFGKSREDLRKAIAEYTGKFRAFASRIGLPAASARELTTQVQAGHEQIIAVINAAEETNDVHLNNRNSDEVLDRLERLCDGRVGAPLSLQELEGARAEAQRRVKEKIPPGYMDRGKLDPSGDYLLWRQLIIEASARKVSVVLITDDKKEDWFRREQGLTLGPRIELYQELHMEAGVSFFLMTTEAFLIQAKQYLKIPVSPATVKQAKELPESILEERLQTAIKQEERWALECEKAEAVRFSLQTQIHDLKLEKEILSERAKQIDFDLNKQGLAELDIISLTEMKHNNYSIRAYLDEQQEELIQALKATDEKLMAMRAEHRVAKKFIREIARFAGSISELRGNDMQ